MKYGLIILASILYQFVSAQDEYSNFVEVASRIEQEHRINLEGQIILERIFLADSMYSFIALSLMRRYPNEQTIEFFCKHIDLISDTTEMNFSRRYPVFQAVYNMHSEHQRKVGRCLLEKVKSNSLDNEVLLRVHFVVNKGFVTKRAYSEIMEEYLNAANGLAKERLLNLQRVGSEWLFEYAEGY